MNRIVITSCSERKNLNEAVMPAIERYNGPTFQLLRKYIRNNEDQLSVFILSAKFGLITHKCQIPHYDERLKDSKVGELSKTVELQADNLFADQKESQEVFINLGNTYLQTITPALNKISHNNQLTFSSGSIGRRLSEMHDWLYGKESSISQAQPFQQSSNSIEFKGIKLAVGKSEIYKLIKNEIETNGIEHIQKTQTWFVPYNNLKISPKWIVSRISGLPVSKFHSDQARTVLQKLGIEINRA